MVISPYLKEWNSNDINDISYGLKVLKTTSYQFRKGKWPFYNVSIYNSVCNIVDLNHSNSVCVWIGNFCWLLWHSDGYRWSL